MLKNWLKTFLDLIYPPKCPLCRKQTDTEEVWCAECLKNNFSTEQVREIPLINHELSSLESCLSVCHYDGIVKKLILDMKFKKNKQNGLKLSYLVQSFLQGKYQFRIDYVVPVPLYAKKQKERGFNQTEEIFRPWAQKENLTWLNCLERVRPTKPQWNLTAKERAENVKDAFALTRLFDAQTQIKGKSILLVDDIFTTGRTIKECALVLKKAQAGKISVLTLSSGSD